MEDWFTVDQIEKDTYIISEYRHWEEARGYLFVGDLVYKDTLLAYYPSKDPEAYLVSLEKIAALPVKSVFPAHHTGYPARDSCSHERCVQKIKDRRKTAPWQWNL